jgi:hypothetical protein
MAETFNYDRDCPLHRNGMRILVLHPGDASEPINFLIGSEPLPTSLRYTALSYVWGPLSPTAQIFIDNLPFSITPNLHEALLALRKTDEYQTLWIDQICINQEDIYEKTEQFKRIGEIYRNAERTIAWLGDCPEPMLNQNVFDIVPILRKALTSLPGLEMRMKIGEHPGLAVLTVLFSVPWFSRVWIIQETVLSKSLTLRWGKQKFAWNDIAEPVYLLRGETESGFGMQIFAGQGQGREGSAPHVVSLVFIQREWQETRNLHLGRLLQPSIVHEAADLRDKVYALFGMTGADAEHLIEPNYETDAASLFRSVAQTVYAGDGNEDFRYLNDNPHKDPAVRLPGLPSWAPDPSPGEAIRGSRPFVEHNLFKAHAGLSTPFIWSEDKNLLIVPGKFIDVLTQSRSILAGNINPPRRLPLRTLFTISTRPFENMTVSLVHFGCASAVRVAQLMEDTKHDSENWWRTLIAGVEGFFTLAGDDCRDHGMLYWEWIKRIHAAILEENLGMVQGLLVFSTREQGTDLVRYTRAAADAG